MTMHRGRATIRGPAVLPTGLVHDAVVEIEGDRIHAVVAVDATGRDDPGGPHVPADGATLVPGMVDVHVHGASGHSAMGGVPSLRAMAAALAQRGVTSFLPTAVSAPLGELAAFAREVRVARKGQARDTGGRHGRAEARIVGANLEGPALAPTHRGMHDAAALRAPSDVLEAWLGDVASWSEVRIVTLAPEQPGGLELVRRLAADGRIASLGHTAATYDEAWAAFDEGARSTTHVFDQMTPLHHRAPGTVGAALTHPAPSVELIADGHHVYQAVWPIVWRTAGDRLMLVSDAIPAAGLGDGDHAWAGSVLQVRGGRATLEDGTTLAGSTSLLDVGLRNIVRAGLDLVRASRATSTRAAEMLGLAHAGRIEPGAYADLLLVSPDGTVERTMLGGRWLDESG